MSYVKIFTYNMCLTLIKFCAKVAAETDSSNRPQVGKKIANGAFGQLRLARHIDTNAEFAIKLEPVNAKIPMLFLEYRFYKTLGVQVTFLLFCCILAMANKIPQLEFLPTNAYILLYI
jgi:hypothetical protein